MSSARERQRVAAAFPPLLIWLHFFGPKGCVPWSVGVRAEVLLDVSQVPARPRECECRGAWAWKQSAACVCVRAFIERGRLRVRALVCA
jgi:hypothetical protein